MMTYDAAPARTSLSLGRLIADGTRDIAAHQSSLHAVRHPASDARLRGGGHDAPLAEAERQVACLGEAALANRASVFADYAAWARVTLAARAVPAADLVTNLECLRQTIDSMLPSAESLCASDIIDAALRRIDGEAPVSTSYLDPQAPLAELAAHFLSSLLAGDRQTASRSILDAVERGTAVGEIYLQVFQRCQQEVGRLWQLNRVSVAQEHFCSAATQLIMSQLYSRIFNTERVGRTMVGASVGGDLHEIGIRMVSDFFELAGWDTFYLGASTPIDALLDTVRLRRPDVIAISATMPYHISEAARLVAALRGAGFEAPPRILVGGRPFLQNDGLWKDIGADASASDASEAVRIAEAMLLATT